MTWYGIVWQDCIYIYIYSYIYKSNEWESLTSTSQGTQYAYRHHSHTALILCLSHTAIQHTWYHQDALWGVETLKWNTLIQIHKGSPNLTCQDSLSLKDWVIGPLQPYSGFRIIETASKLVSFFWFKSQFWAKFLCKDQTGWTLTHAYFRDTQTRVGSLNYFKTLSKVQSRSSGKYFSLKFWLTR